jgi:hypothetical protein
VLVERETHLIRRSCLAPYQRHYCFLLVQPMPASCFLVPMPLGLVVVPELPPSSRASIALICKFEMLKNLRCLLLGQSMVHGRIFKVVDVDSSSIEYLQPAMVGHGRNRSHSLTALSFRSLNNFFLRSLITIRFLFLFPRSLFKRRSSPKKSSERSLCSSGL